MKIVRPCEGCGTVFLPPAKSPRQRFCSRRCICVALNRGINRDPEVIAKRADTRRGSGRGATYIKRDGRHEHRAVAEQNLGRSLLPGEIAHHRDENKRNNAPENIQALASQAEHARLHGLGRKRPPRATCKVGHALTPENTLITSIGRRRCLSCHREYDRLWKQQQRRSAASSQEIAR